MRKTSVASLPYDEAKEAGHKRFVGQTCKRCGGTHRYTKGRICVVCQKVHNKNWKLSEPEKWAASQRKHQEKLKANPAETYNRQREQLAARVAGGWKPRRYPESSLFSDAFYKAKRSHRRREKDDHYRDILVDFTKAEKIALLAGRVNGCAYCHDDGKLHLDHKTPLSRGGEHALSNVQWLCQHHNMSKHAKTHEEYVEWCRARGKELPKIQRAELGQKLLDDLF